MEDFQAQLEVRSLVSELRELILSIENSEDKKDALEYLKKELGI